MAPSIPPLMQSSSAARAVSIRTGIVASSSRSALMRLRTPHPSVPGIITSSTTTSGCSSRTISRARSPLGAVGTRWPSRSRLWRMIVRMSCSSSTARTVAMAPFFSRCVEQRLLSGGGLGSHPSHPRLGLADLGERREVLRRRPDLVEQRLPALGLHRLDEPLPQLVLQKLGLDAEQALDDAGRTTPAPPLVQHPLEAIGTGDEAGARPVHGDVAVALEQAHHPLDLAQHRLLVGAGDEGDQAALVEGVLAGAYLLDRAAEGVEEPLGVGVDRRQALVDPGEEVGAHPRHASELGPVRDFGEGEPQAEL